VAGAQQRGSGVNTRRFDASLTNAGVLNHVSFRIDDHSIEWNWFYLYDPHHAIPKDGQGPNAPRYERINERWWLVVDAAKRVADVMPREHRCTSLGGLATTPTAMKLSEDLARRLHATRR
jgi:hypothetical protein